MVYLSRLVTVDRTVKHLIKLDDKYTDLLVLCS